MKVQYKPGTTNFQKLISSLSMLGFRFERWINNLVKNHHNQFRLQSKIRFIKANGITYTHDSTMKIMRAENCLIKELINGLYQVEYFDRYKKGYSQCGWYNIPNVKILIGPSVIEYVEYK